jgi:hypothetical protein
LNYDKGKRLECNDESATLCLPFCCEQVFEKSLQAYKNDQHRERKYHVLENKLTLTKKSQSLNWGKTQNLYQVAFESLIPSMIRFFL